MLRYAAKLTRAPWEITARDVTELKSTGFEDVDVLAIVEVVGYYAYVNRVANGLGVALESRE